MTNTDEIKEVPHKNIGEAWLAIMGEVGYVQKLGKNKAQDYKYAGEAQLINALRPVLLKHKVICVPGEAKVVNSTCEVVNDKKTYRTVIQYTWVYTHVPSGTHMQVQAIGEGVDTGDKAAYKAATGALKYSLRQPFLIETGDEPEAHDEPEEKLFKNSATRNAYCRSLNDAVVACQSAEELTLVWKEHKPMLDDMAEGEEYDQLGAQGVMTQIKIMGARLRKLEADTKDMDGQS